MRRVPMILLAVAACSAPAALETTTTTALSTTSSAVPITSVTTTSTHATTSTSVLNRPDWLGSRPLPLRSDGYGEVLATPEELQDREFDTEDQLPPPAEERFEWMIGPVPAEVLARSTWHAGCPVSSQELRYLLVSFWGFDGMLHRGEMLLNVSVAEDVLEIFRQLYEARFPIEEMRVVRAEELDLPPTGDGNNTTSFVCRPVVASDGRWSQHAFGLAIDLNPFHNPFEKGDLVIPELASFYLDRSVVRPGMIFDGDPVVTAFDNFGWGWGGQWQTLVDYMHFSTTGG